MPDTRVVNASPVITLAKSGYLDLSMALASEVLVPNAVALEILAAPATDPARQAMEAGWGQRLANVEVRQQCWSGALGTGNRQSLKG
jgi:predicted nucleic acid-binding protein